MCRFPKSTLLLLIGTLALSPATSFAQSTSGLRGHVTDPSGAAIAGARITLTRVDQNISRQAASNADGSYEFAQVTPGAYSVRVSAPGFADQERQRLDLLVSLTATLDFSMQVAQSAQQVEVLSGTVPTINTTDATMGNVFETKQIEQLPIEARNVVELLSLQPGVTYLGKNVDAFNDSRSGSVNGSRSDQSNITLDGVDVNDQQNGYAFTSVLRNTQDSVQEFRVVTSNANADSGRSSGAQVALVTKTGTNIFHGSAYEYNRNTSFAANDYFLKAAELAAGQPNERAKLIRNVFGASLGGPVWKNRLFFFGNYEGRRDRESSSESRVVPTDSFRNGFVKYLNVNGGVSTLTPAQLRAQDPLGVGDNPAILSILQAYPAANDPTVGDGLNTSGFRFAGNEARKFDTYIARIDYNLTSDARQMLFWRGNLQNDKQGSAPQFPGQPPQTLNLDNSKGFALGYTAVLAPTRVNIFRWGFTRQGGENSGISLDPEVTLAGLSSPISFSRSSTYLLPVHNLIDDHSWTKGRHSIQFGANVRLINNQRASYANSFSSANINLGWLVNSGIANKGVDFDPAFAGLTPVDPAFNKSYDNALMTVIGIVTEGNAIYNYDKNGKPLPLGAPVKRHYRWNESEFYGQDAWKITPNITVTYGLRWSLLQPPYEVNGTQVGPCLASGSSCAPLSLTDWLNTSRQQGLTGGTASAAPVIFFAPNGQANGKAPFWKWSYGNVAPRIAVAWSPDLHDSWLGRIFGEKGRTSIRAGYALVYDHFGMATVNSFDSAGSYGLSSNVQNIPGTVTVSSAPRFTGIHDIPAGVLPPAPAGGFPAAPDPSAFAISWGMDRDMQTPYAHTVDFSLSRQLSDNLALDLAYVGRFSRNLPMQEDVAMPLNLVDPKSKTDYFTAATQLSKMASAGVSVGSVKPIPYWENLFGALGGTDLGNGPLSATQVAYSVFQQNIANETYALFQLDLPDSQSGAGLNVPGHSYPSYRFYHSQYSALYAWRTIGTGDYNALQVTLHKRLARGLQGDLNYTWSKSMDWASQAERIPTSGGNNGAQIINTWHPDQLRSVSDFDATHQINGNWLYELPFGRGRTFLSNRGGVVNAILGGWQLNGLIRWTSGLPYSVSEGSQWPTNWDIAGYATLQSIPAAKAIARGSGPNAFQDPAGVLAAFRSALPGESGTRNVLRGDGYFGLDGGLSKVFPIRERLQARLRWDVFNVTNSVRFNVGSINARIDQPSSFGSYTQTLTQPRVMQVALRIEF